MARNQSGIWLCSGVMETLFVKIQVQCIWFKGVSMCVGKGRHFHEKKYLTTLVNLSNCNFIFKIFLIVKYNTDTKMTKGWTPNNHYPI